jgi:hypothetical protein
MIAYVDTENRSSVRTLLPLDLIPYSVGTEIASIPKRR